MFSENHYRPLPKEVIIKQSEIDGYGIFAKENISKDTELGITHVWALGKWIRTPLGGFINHSNNPNAKGVMKNADGTNYRVLTVMRDIKAGEEITFFYTLNEYQGVFA